MPFRPLPLALLVLFALVLTACTQTINVYPVAESAAVPVVAPTPQPETAVPTMQHGAMAPGSMMAMIQQEKSEHEALMAMLFAGDDTDPSPMMEMMRKHGMDHDAMMGMMKMHGMDGGGMTAMIYQAKMDHEAMMEMMAQGALDRAAMIDRMAAHGVRHGAMMDMMADLDADDTAEEEAPLGDEQPADSALPFDAQFIDSMIEHHQGAVDMARLALEQAEHEDLRTMAAAIIEDQQIEIEQMQAWRAAWYPDVPLSAGMGMHMGDMEIADDPAVAFDQRFLQAMISHHRGAIAMAEAVQTQAEHDELKQLADAIIAAQDGEIAKMEAWLSEWYGIEPAPADAAGSGDAAAEGQTDEHETHH